MPKKYRLSGEELRSLSGKSSALGGRRMHGTFFSVLVVPIGGDHAKCATVVSKKVSAKAVDRNKVKRRFRNVLEKRMRTIHKRVALVFSAKHEAKAATFSELEHDIEALLSKL